jgi:hypothetical protein
MSSTTSEDPILRENRRSELARRLLSHGVRTMLITKLTGLSRNRLATVRKRLMVRDKSRPRGPTRSSLEIFLGTPEANSAGAALASLCLVFDLPIDSGVTSLPETVSWVFTEKLCETYEAYRALFPSTEIAFEDLILLIGSLRTGGEVRLGKCGICKGLILIDAYDDPGADAHCAIPDPSATAHG